MQSFAYQDVGVKAVVIVVGTPATDAQRKKWNLSSDLVCGSEAQGILITEEGIRVSNQILSGGIMCRNKGADEKDFWFFAHK